jgi:nucleotide-binding universal stress UspA family protein
VTVSGRGVEEDPMDEQQTRRTVVVGVDGSQEALRAVRWGAAEAGRCGLPLRLVHAVGWVVDPDLGESAIRGDYREALLSRARGRLAVAASAARAVEPGVAIEQHVSAGYQLDVLAEEARLARMLVLGNRGLGRFEELLVGSTAVAMAAHAACPVVVVRGRDIGPTDVDTLPVVVGVDSTTTSAAAVAFGYAAAADRKVPLLAVHTWADAMTDPTMAQLIDWDEVESFEAARLDEQLTEAARRHPEVRVETEVARDRPARRLLRLCERAQLVVVGSRGYGEFAGAVLGSVSNALIHKAACPVAVVRAEV